MAFVPIADSARLKSHMLGRLSKYVPGWRGWLIAALGAVTLLFAPSSSSAPLMQIGAESLDVSAKHLEVDLSKGLAKLEGEVRVKVGELDLSCDRVDLRYDDAPLVRWARGSGN